jgi:hypothetical protein
MWERPSRFWGPIRPAPALTALRESAPWFQLPKTPAPYAVARHRHGRGGSTRRHVVEQGALPGAAMEFGERRHYIMSSHR